MAFLCEKFVFPLLQTPNWPQQLKKKKKLKKKIEETP